MGQLDFASIDNACLTAPPSASRLAAGDAGWERGGSSSSIGRECRICLSAGTEELCQPCDCCGTLGYIHESCLTAWVTEKGSLICELCGQRYKAPYADKLAPLVTAAMQCRKHTLLTTTGTTVTVFPSTLSRGDYICLILSLFFLVAAFVAIVVTLAKNSNAANSAAAQNSAAPGQP